MQSWFWRIIHTPWFASAMFGSSGFFIASLFNDVAVLTHGITSLPFWARVIAGVISGMMVRLGLALSYSWGRHREA